MSAKSHDHESGVTANEDSLARLVGPVSNTDLGMRPSVFVEEMLAKHVGDSTDDDDEILDCEPDFSLDDLEWEERYPDLCEDEE